MDELEKGLIAAGVALLGALTVIIGIVGTYAARYLSTRGELAIEELKRRASDKAVLAVEDETRLKTTSPDDKLTMAQRLADSETPKHVAVKDADVRAAVTRMKASIPTLSSFPPDAMEVVERPTIPRPAPMPRDPTREKAPIR